MRTGHETGSHHRNDERKDNKVYGDVASPRKVNRREQMNDEDSQKRFEKKQAGGIEGVINQIKQDFREPLVVDPRIAVSGIGKWIGIVNPALLPDVLPETEMTP